MQIEDNYEGENPFPGKLFNKLAQTASSMATVFASNAAKLFEKTS